MYDIDLTSRTPIYEQLYKKIVELVHKNVLIPGEQLPSVRQLAKDLNINPNTVQKAYQELERDGIIHSLTGRGNFVSENNTAFITEKVLEDFIIAVKDAMESGFSKQDLITQIEEMRE